MIAVIVQQGKKPPVSSLQRKIFRVMLDKMSGINAFRYLADCESKSDVAPGFMKLMMINKLPGRMGFGEEDVVQMVES